MLIIVSDDRRNLQGLHFKVFVEVQAPFMLPKENYPSLTSNDDPDIIDVTGKFKGLFIDVLDIISRELNFTYSLKRRKDMVWGNYVDGNWTGMIKSILEGEARHRMEITMCVS